MAAATVAADVAARISRRVRLLIGNHLPPWRVGSRRRLRGDAEITRTPGPLVPRDPCSQVGMVSIGTNALLGFDSLGRWQSLTPVCDRPRSRSTSHWYALLRASIPTSPTARSN
jgi:hypothetical protein